MDTALPLALLHAAQAKPMLVELKNGETFNGHLVGCDNFMNLTLKEVYQTSAVRLPLELSLSLRSRARSSGTADLTL
ncbi:SPOSA6832_03969 [Sporobolomyces salmonicolor]|uniref:SPOSA6832_03969-mRNA-1:cds n=1 Tax=Sporidiobolus salmonicolor TaxID=5005 RepID=A0A0D6EQQ6_SPOSA|nr:SPOSA6832_03969 [Sporobolomyces salmonicolor]